MVVSRRAQLVAWLREAQRSLIGLSGLGLVVAGVWGLGGWEWGAITAGLPIATFYLWGEVRAVRVPRVTEGAD